jgi:hypothetical protein
LKIAQTWPATETYINLCEGTVFKKEFFGRWEQNYMFISKSGLIISKDKSCDHCDIFIDSIKELWTRFEFIENSTYIVFKIKHGFRKYEVAVSVDHSVKWIQALCSLIDYQ